MLHLPPLLTPAPMLRVACCYGRRRHSDASPPVPSSFSLRSLPLLLMLLAAAALVGTARAGSEPVRLVSSGGSKDKACIDVKPGDY